MNMFIAALVAYIFGRILISVFRSAIFFPLVTRYYVWRHKSNPGVVPMGYEPMTPPTICECGACESKHFEGPKFCACTKCGVRHRKDADHTKSPLGHGGLLG